MKYEDERYYHIYNRGAHKEKLFYSDENFSFCLGLFRKYIHEYHVSMVAHCLMPNHYHTVLYQQRDGSISKFIQTVFNAYSQSFNRVTGHSGTMFQGRVKGVSVTGNEHLLHLCAYIHRNPVSANLVKKPEDWRFSDYADWIGIRDAGLSDPGIRKDLFQSPDEYRRFVEATIKGDVTPFEG